MPTHHLLSFYQAAMINDSDEPINVSLSIMITMPKNDQGEKVPTPSKCSNSTCSASTLDMRHLPLYQDRSEDKRASAQGVLGKLQMVRARSSIMEFYRQHELGKAILGFAIPVTTGLLAQRNNSSQLVVNLVVIALCVGFAAIWNGLLLRGILPDLGNRLEQIGVAFVLAAFFGLVSSIIPVYLIWAPWACWVLSLVPFGLTLF